MAVRSHGGETVDLHVLSDDRATFTLFVDDPDETRPNPYVARLVNVTFDDLGLPSPTLDDWSFDWGGSGC